MLANSLPSGASSSPGDAVVQRLFRPGDPELDGGVVRPDILFRRPRFTEGVFGVDPAPFAEAGEGFGRRRDALRQGGLRAEGGRDAHPQLGSVRQQVIAVGKPREVSVHAETAGKGDDDVKEHQRQRQRQNGQHRLAAAAAEVGPRHPGEEEPAVFLCLPALSAGVGRPFGGTVPPRPARRSRRVWPDAGRR